MVYDSDTFDSLRCDTYLHAWDEIDSADWWGPAAPNIEPLTLRCIRCGKIRRDTVNVATGELIRRRYLNPPGYTKYKRGERPSRADFRRQLLGLRIREARDARRKK